MTSLDQTRAIHVLRRQIAGFTDDDYRGLLQACYGVSTSTRLTFMQAADVIGELRRLAGPAARNNRRASFTASGPYARTLQALWIAAYNLGIVERRDDRAMLAFVERQTGLSHTRFMVDAADARKAIEGLKAWIAREGALAWPNAQDPIARKRVLVAAQTRLVQRFLPTFDPEKFGALQGIGTRLADYDGHALDRLSAAIGKLIRKDAVKRRKAA